MEEQPTEVAKALHGEQARVEQHPQPETVELPAGTLVAAPAEDDEDDAA